MCADVLVRNRAAGWDRERGGGGDIDFNELV